MAGPRLRFLHAGDFDLDRPLGGIGDVPDDWLDALVDAPFQACAGVFDAAVRECVDFVCAA